VTTVNENVDNIEASKPQVVEQPKVNEKYLKQFIIDVEENIEVFNNALINFEENYENKELINDLFRCMHTIKGSSGIVNAVDIQTVTHSMENLLSPMRENILEPNEDIISVLFEGIDIVRVLIDELRSGERAEHHLETLCQKIQSFIKIDISSEDDLSQQSSNEKMFQQVEKIDVSSFDENIINEIMREAEYGNHLYQVDIK